jgi:hypothetical protein
MAEGPRADASAPPPNGIAGVVYHCYEIALST